MRLVLSKEYIKKNLHEFSTPTENFTGWKLDLLYKNLNSVLEILGSDALEIIQDTKQKTYTVKLTFGLDIQLNLYSNDILIIDGNQVTPTNLKDLKEVYSLF